MGLRVLAALAALVTAAVHLVEYTANGYDKVDVIGPLFLVNVAAGVVTAVLLMTWRHWLPLLLVFGLGLTTLAGFVIASTAGLFGIHETWTGTLVWLGAVSEAVAIVVGVLAGWREGYLSATTASLRTRPARSQSLHSR